MTCPNSSATNAFKMPYSDLVPTRPGSHAPAWEPRLGRSRVPCHNLALALVSKRTGRGSVQEMRSHAGAWERDQPTRERGNEINAWERDQEHEAE